MPQRRPNNPNIKRRIFGLINLDKLAEQAAYMDMSRSEYVDWLIENHRLALKCQPEFRAAVGEPEALPKKYVQESEQKAHDNQIGVHDTGGSVLVRVETDRPPSHCTRCGEESVVVALARAMGMPYE